jgi:hypothetical protein
MYADALRELDIALSLCVRGEIPTYSRSICETFISKDDAIISKNEAILAVMTRVRRVVAAAAMSLPACGK